ncbi:hypothetical protein VYU27_007544 [Nannochloropsis oceanica]
MSTSHAVPDFLLEELGSQAPGLESDGRPELNDDVDRLTRWWLQEEAAPELLPFQTETVQDLHALVEQQQGFVDESRNTVEEASSALLYQMEIDRYTPSLPPSLPACPGADPFAKDKEGVSPLDMVMMSGHKASIQALSRAMRTQLASFLGLALLFLLYRRGGSPQQAWLVLATLWPLGKTWHLLLLLGKEKGAARERALGEWLTYWALLVPVVLLEHAVSAHLLPSPIFQQLLAPRSQGRQENGAVLRTLTDLYMITKIVATIYLIYPASRGARRVSRWLEGRREGGREEKMKKTRDGNDEKIKKKDD